MKRPTAAEKYAHRVFTRLLYHSPGGVRHCVVGRAHRRYTLSSGMPPFKPWPGQAAAAMNNNVQRRELRVRATIMFGENRPYVRTSSETEQKQQTSRYHLGEITAARTRYGSAVSRPTDVRNDTTQHDTTRHNTTRQRRQNSKHRHRQRRRRKAD